MLISVWGFLRQHVFGGFMLMPSTGFRAVLLLVVLSLSACGKNQDPDYSNHGYGFHYDADVNGVRVRYDTTRPQLTPAQIAQLWADVSACMGVSSPGPLVVVTDSPVLSSEGYALPALAFLDTRTVIVSADVGDTWRVSYWGYKHEFVHIALQDQGYPAELNQNHQSPAFFDCVQPPL